MPKTEEISAFAQATPIASTATTPAAATEPTAAKPSWTSHLSLAPVVLGLLTAMFYLNGRAYFLGYLGYFHLDPTMFSDDLSQQVSRSVSAWLGKFKIHTIPPTSTLRKRSLAGRIRGLMSSE